MLCSDRHSRVSSIFLLSQEFPFFHFWAFMLSCSAPGPAAHPHQSPNATTQLLIYFLSFVLSFIILTHTLKIIAYCLLSFFFTRRTFFYIFALSFFLCSFIDYLNVTTKLDISTSSNKLGFVFFCFFFYLNVFLFTLNIFCFF